MNAIVADRLPKQLARESPLKMVISGHDGGGHGECYFPWAYRMDRVGEVSSTYVNDVDEFFLDSAISDDDVTNEDVVEAALTHEPDYVLAADVLFEQELTTDRVIEFLDMMDDAGIESTPIIPLQPSAEGKSDHDKHFDEMEHLGDYFAIGGVKDAPASVKRDAVENVREVAPDVTLHGLGFGVGYFADPRVLADVQLDSLDSFGPTAQAKSGSYWVWQDGRLVECELERDSGDFTLLPVAMAAGATWCSLAQMILAGERPPEELRDAGQSGFENFKAIADGGVE